MNRQPEQLNPTTEAFAFPVVEITASDVLKATGEIAGDAGKLISEHRRPLAVTAVLVAGALGLTGDVAHAQDLTQSIGDVDLGELAILAFDSMKWPVIIAGGGAGRILIQRKREYKTYAQQHKLYSALAEEKSRSIGVMGDKKAKEEAAGLQAQVGQLQAVMRDYKDRGLTGLGSREMWREAGEGFVLALLIDFSPEAMKLGLDQLRKVWGLYSTDLGQFAQEGIKLGLGTIAYAVMWGVAGYRFIQIQHPGGRAGLQQEKLMDRAQKQQEAAEKAAKQSSAAAPAKSSGNASSKRPSLKESIAANRHKTRGY